MDFGVVLFAAFLAVSVRGEPTALCFASFANVAAIDGTPTELIQKTYVDLLDQLGGSLTPETFRRLAESENPFAIPDQPGTDVGTLRRKLADFEGMLESRGWRTAEILSGVREIAARRAEAQGVVRQATEETVTGTWNNRMLSVPDTSRLLISPDGKHILTMREATPDEVTIQVTDLLTGEVSSEFLVGRVDGIRLSSDGKSLLLNVAREYVRIPIENGKLRLDRREVVGTSARKKDFVGAAVTVANPDLVYGRSGQRDIRRFEFNRKKSTLLKLNGQPLDMTKIYDWGQVNGTNDLYINEDDLKTSTLIRYAFDARGRGKIVGEPWRVPYVPGSVLKWGRDGRYLVRHQQGSVLVYPSRNAPALTLGPFPTETDSLNPILKAVLPHPLRDEVGVLYRQPAKGTTELSWFDAATGKRLRSTQFATNGIRGATLSEDGERLIFLYDKTDQLQVVNPNFEN